MTNFTSPFQNTTQKFRGLSDLDHVASYKKCHNLSNKNMYGSCSFGLDFSWYSTRVTFCL